jgi:hypothetical protein
MRDWPQVYERPKKKWLQRANHVCLVTCTQMTPEAEGLDSADEILELAFCYEAVSASLEASVAA